MRDGEIHDKSPCDWHRLCCLLLQQRPEFVVGECPSREVLLARGLSLDQVDFFERSRKNAVIRKLNMWKWNSWMPPFARQCFESPGEVARGIRIPVPPSRRDLQCLPACKPVGSELRDVSFTWLEENHPHTLDARVRFQEEGHLYFVDGIAVELSVTGVLAQYSEAGDLFFWMIPLFYCV